MTAVMAALVAHLLRQAVPDGGGTTGVFLDLTNLQWWQTLVGILGVLGLSPAPWLLGLATGRIQFSAPARADFEAQKKEMRDAHERELNARDRQSVLLLELAEQRYSELQQANQANIEAAERHRRRADEVTDAALEMSEVVRASTHVMASVGEAARVVATEEEDGS